MIKKIWKKLKKIWFEWKLRRTYNPDSYVYEDNEK